MKTNLLDRLPDPESALAGLLECLVLSFQPAPDQSTFALVSDYPHKSPGSTRAFVALVFYQVENYTRELGSLGMLAGHGQAYQATPDGRAVVIQTIRSEVGHAGKTHVALWFGPNFGGVSFAYGRLEGFARSAMVVEVDGEYVYRDAQTREPFDFYRPFPFLGHDLMASPRS